MSTRQQLANGSARIRSIPTSGLKSGPADELIREQLGKPVGMPLPEKIAQLCCEELRRLRKGRSMPEADALQCLAREVSAAEQALDRVRVRVQRLGCRLIGD